MSFTDRLWFWWNIELDAADRLCIEALCWLTFGLMVVLAEYALLSWPAFRLLTGGCACIATVWGLVDAYRKHKERKPH